MQREDVDEARVLAGRSTELMLAAGITPRADWLMGCAWLAVAEGKAGLAARWLGAIERIRDDGVGILLPSEIFGFESPEVGARAALGEDYETHFREGRTLATEEVWREALDCSLGA